MLRGEQLLGFRLSTAQADLRAAGHRIADIVYEELTGIPGVFSTSIAYVNETRNPDGSQRFRLIVADSDGENSRVIADSPDPLMSPAWSPDGRRIAYVSFEGENSAVYVQTLRTGTRDRVSSREGVNSAPAFSPDGRRLALTLSRDGNLDIYTIDLATQVFQTPDAKLVHRHRAHLERGRRIDLLHVRSRRRAADLPNSVRSAGRPGRTRDLRGQL